MSYLPDGAFRLNMQREKFFPRQTYESQTLEVHRIRLSNRLLDL